MKTPLNKSSDAWTETVLDARLSRRVVPGKEMVVRWITLDRTGLVAYGMSRPEWSAVVQIVDANLRDNLGTKVPKKGKNND